MVSVEQIKEKLKQLDPIQVSVTDKSDGCGLNYEVLIVSNKFEGLSLIQRHRLVNSILKQEIQSLHAFS